MSKKQIISSQMKQTYVLMDLALYVADKIFNAHCEEQDPDLSSWDEVSGQYVVY